MNRWYIRFVTNFIRRFIPRRGKRLIFITLCYALWSRSKDETRTKHEMIEINNQLGLCHDEEALYFVILLQQVLKRSTEYQDLKQYEGNELKDNMKKKIPSWLHYGNDNEVNKDVDLVCNPRYCHF